VEAIRAFRRVHDDRAGSHAGLAEPASFVLEWESGKRDAFSVEHGVVFEEMLGSHIRRFNRQCQTRIAELKEIRAQFISVPFANENAEHEAMLRGLWNVAFPGVEYRGRPSNEWKKVGFQGSDPATDFRGMGIWGLINLHHFALKHEDSMRAWIAGERSYPLAVAGINLTEFLARSLRIHNRKLIARDDSPPQAWSSPMMVFLSHCQGTTSEVWNELYAILFHFLDREWVRVGAGYMDFPTVMSSIDAAVDRALDRRPHSRDEFSALLMRERVVL
jgi:hypothetical protein